MAENLGFTKIAKGLARNPMGIFSLFVIYAQAIASLLLRFPGDNLRAGERAPLIWFIVVFPCLVLLVFTYLVIFHHGKLYGPTEHRTVDSFYGVSNPQQIDKRLAQKIVTVTATGHDRSSGSTERQDSVNAQIVMEQNRSKFLLAQSLSIRKLEQIYGFNFAKQISFGGEISMAFDAVALNGDTFNAVEIKLLAQPILISSEFLEVLYRGSLASRFIEEKSDNRFFRLILVVVLESFEDLVERFELEVRRIIQDSSFPIDFHIFSFSELRHDFRTQSD